MEPIGHQMIHLLNWFGTTDKLFFDASEKLLFSPGLGRKRPESKIIWKLNFICYKLNGGFIFILNSSSQFLIKAL